MNKTIYVDVGSSTVKIYRKTQKGTIELLETKSFHFKQDFDPHYGITEKNKQELISYVKRAQKTYKKHVIKVYATAVFRKLSEAARITMVDDFFRSTGLFFNIVSHELESHYLEQALSAEYKLDQPLLLINIGGGSTELIALESGKVTNRYNLELGVGSVLRDFPFLNEPHSRHKLDTVVSTLRKQLPTITFHTPYGIYNGGELTYMQRVGYQLDKNTAFQDSEHPYSITAEHFAAKNQEVFSTLNLAQLEALMPSDPLWMHGARACSAIAQAIVEHFKIQTLIPSDSNMVHGIVRRELRTAGAVRNSTYTLASGR